MVLKDPRVIRCLAAVRAKVRPQHAPLEQCTTAEEVAAHYVARATKQANIRESGDSVDGCPCVRVTQLNEAGLDDVTVRASSRTGKYVRMGESFTAEGLALHKAYLECKQARELAERRAAKAKAAERAAGRSDQSSFGEQRAWWLTKTAEREAAEEKVVSAKAAELEAWEPKAAYEKARLFEAEVKAAKAGVEKAERKKARKAAREAKAEAKAEARAAKAADQVSAPSL